MNQSHITLQDSDLFLDGMNIPYIPETRLYLDLEDTVLSKDYIRELIATFGLGNDFYRTIECESGFQHEGLFGDNGKAYGILQFHRPTFDSFCEGDYYNLEDQLECGAKMFSSGLQHHWTCFNLLQYAK